MTQVCGRLAPGQAVEAADFADLTTVRVESVGFDNEGRVCVTFASDLDERTQAAVRRRIVSSSPAEEKVRAEVEAFPDEVADWTSTTNVATLAAQVDALTKQVTALTQLVVDFNMGAALPLPAPTLAPSKATEAPRATTRK